MSVQLFNLSLFLTLLLSVSLTTEVVSGANYYGDLVDLFPRLTRLGSGSGRWSVDEERRGQAATYSDVKVSPLLRETWSSLRQLLRFFIRNTDDINLDGVIGTRIVDGQLTVLLARMKSSPERYPEKNSRKYLEQEIESLALLAKDVSDIARKRVMINDKKYFADVGTMISNGFWEMDYPSRQTNPEHVYPVVFAEEALNETVTDYCISEMLGSGASGMTCTISDYCWNLMTKPKYSKYSLTHQIIYLQAGESMECDRQMEEATRLYQQVSLAHLLNVFCANVFREMKENAAEDFPEQRRDLFMEQAAICGMLGFRDLFRVSWLKRILSWQWPEEGCFGRARHSEQNSSAIMRGKREEQRLKDGCLSHMSAVAAAAMSLYIRYLVEDPTLGGATNVASRYL